MGSLCPPSSIEKAVGFTKDRTMKNGDNLSVPTTTLPPGSASNSSFVATPGKRTPGKLALCTRCGTQSENLSTCGRCKRKLPEDVKLLDDPAFKTQESDIKVEKSLKLKMLIRTRQYQIVSECVDEQWSPVDLGKKWGCSADNIRQWVNEAGKVLPKTYKKTEYNSESRTSTPGTMKTGNNASLPTTPLPPGLLGVAIGQLETYKKTERGRD